MCDVQQEGEIMRIYNLQHNVSVINEKILKIIVVSKKQLSKCTLIIITTPQLYEM